LRRADKRRAHPVAAPLCTVRLAYAGARVIKIERTEGETARHYDSSVEGMSAYFVWLNRGKESAALDLKASEDLALLHRLVAKADIFVQNLAPGATDRLGLSRAALVEKFPRLISVHIVGYGQDTPYTDMRAYDMLVQAESGVCAVMGSPDTPSKIAVSAADIATGMNAHAAALDPLRIAAHSFARPPGRAQAHRRDHPFDLDTISCGIRGLRQIREDKPGADL
jgi:itaconate CoA-transferase